VRIRITNPGEVPAAVRERFFERGVTVGKARGSGLGTYIARRLAEVQNGRVELDTRVAGQTTVTVWLPRAPVDPDASQTHWATGDWSTR
jgi:signal transduction histidine kinase